MTNEPAQKNGSERMALPLSMAVPLGWLADFALLLFAVRWAAALAQWASGTEMARAVRFSLIFATFKTSLFTLSAFALVFAVWFLASTLLGAPSPGLAALGYRRIRRKGALSPWLQLPAFLAAIPFAFVAPLMAPLSRSKRTGLDVSLGYVYVAPMQRSRRALPILAALLLLNAAAAALLPMLKAAPARFPSPLLQVKFDDEKAGANGRNAQKSLAASYKKIALGGVQELEAYVNSHMKIDNSYGGKYKTNPYFQGLTPNIRMHMLASMKRVYETTGLLPAKDSFIWISFRDGETSAGGGAFLGYCQPVYDGDKMTPIVVLFTEPLATNAIDLADLMTHELTHAVMMTLVSHPLFGRIPEWFLEGSAQLATQNPDRQVEYAAIMTNGQGEKLLDGLDIHRLRHGWDDYSEDYLALKYLAKRGFPSFTKDYLLALRTGADPIRWMEETTGRPWEKFLEEFHRSAMETLYPSAFGGRFSTFRQAEQMMQAGRLPEAYKLMMDLIKEKGDSFWKAKAQFTIGQIHMMGGDYKTARLAFQATAEEYADSPLADPAAYFVGRSLLLEGLYDRAVYSLGEFIDNRPFSPLKYDALLDRAEGHLKTYDYPNAIIDAERIRREYPMFGDMKRLKAIEDEAREKQRKRETEPQPF